MKKVKSLAAIFLIFTLAVSFTACGEIKKAEKAVNGMFTAFQNNELEEARKYVDVDDVLNSEDENSEMVKKVTELVFSKLDYEILSSEKTDNNNVVVKTKITAVDMKPIMTDFMAKALEYAFSYAFSDSQPTEEESNKKMEEILFDCISKSDFATVSDEVDIKVSKDENKEWKIAVEDTFVDALLGGLSSAAEEMQKSLNSAN